MTGDTSERDGRGSHVIVCGDSALAYLLAEALVSQFDDHVTVILRSVTDREGPKIAQLAHVDVVEARQPTEDALLEAGVREAEAVALVDQDDVGNIHTALRVHELNPDARLVIRFFNMSLGERIRTLFPGSAVLSDSATAAPSFVAAALDELPPNRVQLARGTLYVARRDEITDGQLVCGLADTTGSNGTRLLPVDWRDADLVLALADDPDAAMATARRRPTLRELWFRIRAPFNRKLAIATLAVLALLGLGTTLFALFSGYSWADAVYLTLLDASGAAQPDVALAPAAKITQTMLSILGVAFLPLIIAVVVDAVVGVRLASALGRPRPIAGHVVVVGLGNVGTRVVRELHALGIPVVCVETDEHARGVALIRRFGLPIVFGDAAREDTLRAAYVGTSRALIAVTSNDVTNLEAGLHGRTIKADLRVVLRLLDNDLANRVQSNFGITISRSVSFLAAPAFAAAMVRREVLGTIPLGRSMLLIAEIPVRPGAELDGLSAQTIHTPGEARVIAIHRAATDALDLSVPAGYTLAGGDRLIVLATRTGLGRVLARSVGAPL